MFSPWMDDSNMLQIKVRLVTVRFGGLHLEGLFDMGP